MDEKDLIEKLKEGLRADFPLALEPNEGWLWHYEYLIAKSALSVVCKNISMVAEVCPECDGEGKQTVGWVQEIEPSLLDAGCQKAINEVCDKCKGFGIIAKQERVN